MPRIIEWVEIDATAHILYMKGTMCGLPLDHATVIVPGDLAGCMDCISAYGEAHTPRTPSFMSDE